MDVSIATIIKLTKELKLLPCKGHLQSTGNSHQSVYFNSTTNTRLIIEASNNTCTIWEIPTNIFIPTENDMKNFVEHVIDVEFITEPEFIGLINNIAGIESSLVTELIKLTIAGRGKAIVVK